MNYGQKSFMTLTPGLPDLQEQDDDRGQVRQVTQEPEKVHFLSFENFFGTK
jgi:hypothetical protein